MSDVLYLCPLWHRLNLILNQFPLKRWVIASLQIYRYKVIEIENKIISRSALQVLG